MEVTQHDSVSEESLSSNEQTDEVGLEPPAVSNNSNCTGDSPSNPNDKKEDPKAWTLDDVECSDDYSKVQSVAGMSTSLRSSGLTVQKLRTFCSVLPGLPKGYSNANRDTLLAMIANRKKGIQYLCTFSNGVENRTETPLPLNRRRGKKPGSLTKVGTCLRFVNAFFHQEMKEHMSQIKNRLEIKELDKRQKIPHDGAWAAMEVFFNLSPNEDIDKFPLSMGKADFWREYSIDENTPSQFDVMDKEDLYLLYEFFSRKYRDAHRNYKSSGNHEDFDRFSDRDKVVTPGIYYFHLSFMECSDPCHKSQVTNMLPSGVMLQSLEDDDSVCSDNRRKRNSPTEEFRKGMLDSRSKLTDFFAMIGQEKRRDNDRKDVIENKNAKIRKLDLEKSIQNQFTFLLDTNNDLKNKSEHATESERRLIQILIAKNEKRMEKLVEELD